MFIVTFYSYKGGVGRTMALANTAASLARRGKRVLCVDFDLEAPSLPSYGCFHDRKGSDGIVDFVSEYRRTSFAPDISSYITACEASGNKIWLMPAGNTSSPSYSEKLASIDWSKLYKDEMGYLLFEDIKQQWASYDEIGFDYVLVDSRTGHTDVGGICTRQLPNLVVVMFSPTEQNISGLKPIVSDIKKEISRKKNPVSIRFCASNIPDLDDESGILADILTSASHELSFDSADLLRIHHYSSLAILSHSIFVTDRPNSKLAKEYEALAREIASCNLEDSEGAKTALRKALAKMSRSRRSPSAQAREEAKQEADKLLTQHPNDSEIAYLVANIRNLSGDIPGEIEALSKVLEAGDNRSSIYIMRARALRALNNFPSSEADLRAVLNDPSASGSDIAAALRMLEGIGIDILPEVTALLSRDDVSFDVLGGIPESALRRRRDVERFAELLITRYRNQDTSQADLVFTRANLILSLIGARRFKEAIEIILDHYDDEGDAGMSIADSFNLFVAKWGLEGAVPMLKNLGNLFADESESVFQSANFHQCKGLWHAAEGRVQDAIRCFEESLKLIERETGAFSCLSYLYRTKEEFSRETLSVITKLNQGHAVEPLFFSKDDDESY